MKVLFVILSSYLSAVIALVTLALVYRSSKHKKYLISEDSKRTKSPEAHRYYSIVNSVISIMLIFSILYGFTNQLIHEKELVIWHFVLEAFLVITIYDFGYYAMHRFLFHGWQPLIKIHAVHHSVKHPRATDSLMLHPVETVMGLMLFFGSVAIVGGVHLYTLAMLFTVYTAFMILNHAGVNYPHFPFNTLGLLAVKHDQHHHSMKHKNYAAVTPFPDMIFRTVEVAKR